MDPITILAGCTAAYNAIKSGISVGKEIQGMIGDVSSIMDSVGQLTQVASNPKPSLMSGKSAQAIAMEAYAAKAEAERMYHEVKNAFIAQYGLNAWDSVQAETIRIKKEQKLAAQKAAHEAEKAQEELFHNLKVFGFAALVIIVLIVGIVVTFLSIHR